MSELTAVERKTDETPTEKLTTKVCVVNEKTDPVTKKRKADSLEVESTKKISVRPPMRNPLPQRGYKRTMNVEATAYCPGTSGSGCPIDKNGHSQCTGFYNDGRTATGKIAKAGDGTKENPHLIATDPRHIPLGTLVYIENYGFAVAEDTGSAIQGNKIDVLFEKHNDAVKFGRQQVRLYVIK